MGCKKKGEACFEAESRVLGPFTWIRDRNETALTKILMHFSIQGFGKTNTADYTNTSEFPAWP